MSSRVGKQRERRLSSTPRRQKTEKLERNRLHARGGGETGRTTPDPLPTTGKSVLDAKRPEPYACSTDLRVENAVVVVVVHVVLVDLQPDDLGRGHASRAVRHRVHRAHVQQPQHVYGAVQAQVHDVDERRRLWRLWLWTVRHGARSGPCSRRRRGRVDAVQARIRRQRTDARLDDGPARGRGPERSQRERDAGPETRGRQYDATVPGHLEPAVDDCPRVVRVRPRHAGAQHVVVVTPVRRRGRRRRGAQTERRRRRVQHQQQQQRQHRRRRGRSGRERLRRPAFVAPADERSCSDRRCVSDGAAYAPSRAIPTVPGKLSPVRGGGSERAKRKFSRVSFSRRTVVITVFARKNF